MDQTLTSSEHVNLSYTVTIRSQRSNKFVKIKLNEDKDLPRKFRAKLLGFSENKIKIFIEDESDLNGEHYLDPLVIKEAILSWVEKDPPMPNLIS